MSDAGPAPLPARSVLLSVLLGSHPPTLPVRTLVRTAGLFGISEGTARVALSRLSADGDVRADGGTYRLSSRHLQRQQDQDVALRPPTRPWRGVWVLAVLVPDADGRSSSAGPEMRRELERQRMAELRPGVWARPDNLSTSPSPFAVFWTARPDPAGPTSRELAARLWDLGAWAKQAQALLAEMADATEPALRLSVAAAMVRHIRSDPVLPAPLLPDGWPGRRLRRAYDGYRAELGELIAQLRDD